MHEVNNMTWRERDSHRDELAEMLDHVQNRADNYSYSNVIVGQVMETAISALAVIRRVEMLARRFESAEQGAVGYAIASEIRAALA